jgi:hypothetical protein
MAADCIRRRGRLLGAERKQTPGAHSLLILSDFQLHDWIVAQWAAASFKRWAMLIVSKVHLHCRLPLPMQCYRRCTKRRRTHFCLEVFWTIVRGSWRRTRSSTFAVTHAIGSRCTHPILQVWRLPEQLQDLQRLVRSGNPSIAGRL